MNTQQSPISSTTLIPKETTVITNDISNTLLYSQQCIICLQNEPVLDLCNNAHCSCIFTYHVKCYTQWQETQQYKKCFLCNKPIIDIRTNTMRIVNPIHDALHTITDTNVMSVNTDTNTENDANIHLVEMTSYDFRLFMFWKIWYNNFWFILIVNLIVSICVGFLSYLIICDTQ
jgi:hypothetical protein